MSASVERPSGLVTFLFTDIEGSTRLAQLLGGSYRSVLHEHRRLLRHAFSAMCGVEMFTEGDSFFYVFPDARAALTACVAGQRALLSHAWPSPAGQPKVRMGLHSGWARPHGGEYASPEVHRAARVAAAAHGGQVLCSAATAAHCQPLAGDLRLRDLGLFRLRGFDDRERLFQLVAPGLPQVFPHPRTEAASTHNLPAQITPFVGRRAETARLAELLSEHRLVTLVGAGGAGKTRLAAEVAAGKVAEYPDGVWFVDLAAVRDPKLVAVTVAGTLGLRPEPGRPVLQTLAEYVSSRRMLLMLDTCDAHTSAAAAMVAAVLTAGPHATVLATSREPLGLVGEVVWRIPPLSVQPGTDDEPGDAVALLAQRTAAARGGIPVEPTELPALTRIAARLGGLPLAIELAAARLRVLAAEQLAERLEVELAGGARDLLDTIDAGRSPLARGGNPPPVGAGSPAGADASPPEGGVSEPSDLTGLELPGARHATLESAVNWSYRTLDPVAARMLRAVSVFAGPVDLAAADWMLTTDPLPALSTLVDKSLLHTVPIDAAGPVRYAYGMLEPIRAFAARALALAGEEPATRGRHVAWVLDTLRRARLNDEGEPETLSMYRLDPLAAEVRAALHWCVTDGSVVDGLRLVHGMEQWWRERGLAREARMWLSRLYGRMGETGETVDDRLLATAYHVHSLQAGSDGEITEQRRYAELAEVAARRVDDPGLLARVLASWCWSLRDIGQYEQAEQAAREVIDWAEVHGVGQDALFAVICLAQLLWRRGALDEAAELLGSARAAEAVRPEARGRRDVDMLLGMVALARNDLVAAHDHLVVALRSRMAHGFHMRVCDTLAAMAVRCAAGGDPITAVRLFGAARTHRSRLRARQSGFLSYWNDQEQKLRSRLGDQRFDAAYAEGSALSLTDAVTAALAVDQEVADPAASTDSTEPAQTGRNSPA